MSRQVNCFARVKELEQEFDGLFKIHRTRSIALIPTTLLFKCISDPL